MIMGTIEKALKKQQKTIDLTTAEQAISTVVKNKPEVSLSTVNNNQIDISEFERDIENNFSEHNAVQQVSSGGAQHSQKIEIDIERLKDMGFITSLESNTLLNAEFREIKRPLLQNIRGKSAHKIEYANLIQVTSSLQGEGKTFTSVNLAIAIAMELDYRVLLVDADVIKSSVSKTMGIDKEYGLTDYLQGDISNLSEVMLNTSIPKLSVLPSGKRHDLSTELLNSDFMDNLFYELSSRYKDRVIIIDSPPLLETNESRVIAQKVGQIVFVVEHNKTTQTSIKNALSLLDPEMVIGLVMNKNRSGSKSSYYGYGYGYGADVE